MAIPLPGRAAIIDPKTGQLTAEGQRWVTALSSVIEPTAPLEAAIASLTATVNSQGATLTALSGTVTTLSGAVSTHTTDIAALQQRAKDLETTEALTRWL